MPFWSHLQFWFRVPVLALCFSFGLQPSVLVRALVLAVAFGFGLLLQFWPHLHAHFVRGGSVGAWRPSYGAGAGCDLAPLVR